MVRDTVTPPARRGPAGLPRRRALLRRLPREPGLRARGAADGVRGRRRGRRALRHQRRHAARLGRRRRRTTSSRRTGARVGIHCHNDTGCAVANTLAAVDAGATHVQGTHQRLRRAHRQRRPRRRRRQPRAQAGPAGAAARPARATRPGSRTRSPRSPTSRRRRGSRTSAPRRSRTRPACTRAPSRSTPTSTSTWTRRASATTCGCWSPTWPAGRRSSSRARSSASTSPATASWSPGSPTGSRSWSSAATPSRPPTRPSSCCSSRRSRARGRRTSTSSRGASSPRPARAGDEAVSEATVKLQAEGVRYVVTGEGNGPVNALDHGAARGDRAGLPGGREVRADRLQGAHPRPGPRHRRDHPGADRDQRRRVARGSPSGSAHNVIEASWGALVDGAHLRPAPPAR